MSIMYDSFSGNVQQNDVLSLYLEAIYVLVSNLSVAIRQQKGLYRCFMVRRIMLFCYGWDAGPEDL